VACKVICEEFIRAGIPVIAVDPQGDIASMALSAQPERLREKGLDPELLDEYQARAEVVIWTPASSIGVPLSVNPLEQLNVKGLAPEERIRSLSALAQNITGVLGYDLGRDEGRAVSGFFYLVLEQIVTQELPVRSFASLADLLNELPEALREQSEKIISEKKREQIQRKVQLLSLGAQQLLFQLGVPLEIPRLLGLEAGCDPQKTRLSVIYLNTLHTQAEKAFLLAQLSQALYNWMLEQPSEQPQALLYIDEVAPFLPPVSKPACKESLSLLFKQARKYGVSCLLASQNPGDIDYKSLAQFSTWNLGRMMVRQDIRKVEKTIRSIAGAETEAVIKSLPNLGPGEFRLLAPDSFERAVSLRVRWLLTQHKTLDEDSIPELMNSQLRAGLMEKIERRIPQVLPIKPSTPRSEILPVDQEPPAPLLQPEELPEPPRPFIEILEERIKDSKRAWTLRELQDEFDRSAGALRKPLGELERLKKIHKEKFGRSNFYWSKGYRFFPDYGLSEPVQVACLKIYEREAMAAAQAEGSSLFGLIKRSLPAPSFEHQALWQLRFTVSISSGFLFWKEIKRRSEHLYFHPRSGDLLLVDGRGLRFLSIVDQNPEEIRDLDDICQFEEKAPNELGLNRRRLKAMMSAEEIIKVAQRKFPIQIESARLVFLPYWRFQPPGKEPALAIDGILGARFL